MRSNGGPLGVGVRGRSRRYRRCTHAGDAAGVQGERTTRRRNQAQHRELDDHPHGALPSETSIANATPGADRFKAGPIGRGPPDAAMMGATTCERGSTMADVTVVRGGTIVDGTGAPGVRR